MRAGRVYEDRELKAFRSDVDTWVSKYVRTTESNEDWAADEERLGTAVNVEGMVVVISVCTSTRSSMVV